MKARILLTVFIALLLTILISPVNPAALQTPTPIPFEEPAGCKRPPDDYTRVQIGENTLNARTIAMLEHAHTLYSGTIDLAGAAITQGSYNVGEVALSFGTHDGGGTVDISVRNLPVDWSIRWDDIPILVQALRTAGFAAFFRDETDGMTPHIHAVAVGDAELSYAAALQLDGRYGYFRGFNALPQLDGVPEPDFDGEMILCNWMRDMGYRDLRNETVVFTPPYAFSPGDTIFVNMLNGQELNFRVQPTISAEILLKLPSETPLAVLAWPRLADGYQWWMLQTEDGITGWAVEAVDGGYTLVP